MEKGQCGHRTAAVGRRAGFAARPQPGDLLLPEPVVAFDARHLRFGVRIEAVEQQGGRSGVAAQHLQFEVGQFAGDAGRVERMRAGRGETSDLGAREVLLGVVVAQHRAIGNPAAFHRVEQAAPHRFGGGARHHVAREDDQIGAFPGQDTVQPCEGLPGLRESAGRGGIEVYVGKLRDFERPVFAETQCRGLCLRGDDAPDGGAGQNDRSFHVRGMIRVNRVSLRRSFRHARCGSVRRPTTP